MSGGFAHGRFDPSEAGKIGGKRSGEVRAGLSKLDPDVIAAKLARSPHSPLALRAALMYAVKRESGVERQRRLADEVVSELMDEEDRLRGRVDALEAREAELRERLDTDAAGWLGELGEDRVEHALRELGWLDEGDDHAPAA
jgi:hypothetical protein